MVGEWVADETAKLDMNGGSGASDPAMAYLEEIQARQQMVLQGVMPHKPKVVSVKCTACSLEFSSQSVYDSHIAGSKHQKKVTLLSVLHFYTSEFFYTLSISERLLNIWHLILFYLLYDMLLYVNKQ